MLVGEQPGNEEELRGEGEQAEQLRRTLIAGLKRAHTLSSGDG